jgi:hypothetical protein
VGGLVALHVILLAVLLSCTGSAAVPQDDEPITHTITNEDAEALGLPPAEAEHLAGLLRAWVSGLETKLTAKTDLPAINNTQILVIAVADLLMAIGIWVLRNRTRGSAFQNLTQALGDSVPTLATDHTGRPVVRPPTKSKP